MLLPDFDGFITYERPFYCAGDPGKQWVSFRRGIVEYVEGGAEQSPPANFFRAGASLFKHKSKSFYSYPSYRNMQRDCGEINGVSRGNDGQGFFVHSFPTPHHWQSAIPALLYGR